MQKYIFIHNHSKQTETFNWLALILITPAYILRAALPPNKTQLSWLCLIIRGIGEDELIISIGCFNF